MSNDKNNKQPILTIEEQQFQEVLGIIQLHRQAAAKAVNEEALLIYWHVGAYVSAKLQGQEWGSAVVTRLSEYLRVQDPTLIGYGRSSSLQVEYALSRSMNPWAAPNWRPTSSVPPKPRKNSAERISTARQKPIGLITK